MFPVETVGVTQIITMADLIFLPPKGRNCAENPKPTITGLAHLRQKAARISAKMTLLSSSCIVHIVSVDAP
jgi:hypothetical protein